MSNQSQLIDIDGDQIVDMLHAKGASSMVIAHQHGFNFADVVKVIHGQECYPNIARIVAEAIGTTKEMLWPSLYLLPVMSPAHTSVFVLRVTLP